MSNINKIVTAGNKGKKVRSDCFVTLELTSSGGINIDLVSKVKVLFGKSIIELCEKELDFFGIKNANVKIEILSKSITLETNKTVNVKIFQ